MTDLLHSERIGPDPHTVLRTDFEITPAETTPGKEAGETLASCIWYASGHSFLALLGPADDPEGRIDLADGQRWERSEEVADERMFVLTEGNLLVKSRLIESEQPLAAVLNPGDVVGSVNVRQAFGFERTETVESIVAQGSCAGVMLPHHEAMRRAATWRLPAIALPTSGLLRSQLSTHPLFTLFRPLSGRIAGLLLEGAECAQGKVPWDRGIRRVRLSMDDLAHLACCDRPSAALIAEEWIAQGWVDHVRGRFVILDELALKRISRAGY